jgi:hypothetical protein
VLSATGGKKFPEMRVEFLGVTRRGNGKSAVFVIRFGSGFLRRSDSEVGEQARKSREGRR